MDVGEKEPWRKTKVAIMVFEKLFQTEGRKPAEELHKLLTEVRVRHDRFKVTLGSPPFERDDFARITGFRLRFEPSRAGR